MSQYPSAIGAAYPLGKINQAIRLYEGALDLNYQGSKVHGSGTFFFNWFPYPHIEFHFSHESIDFDLKQSEPLNSEVLLNSPSFKGLKANVLEPSNIRVVAKEALIQEYRNRISGQLQNPVLLVYSQETSYVLFHLTNFHRFLGSSITSQHVDHPWSGRVVLEAEGWKVTIDARENIADLVCSLRSSSGFAVTHIGKLEKVNGKTFTAEEALSFLEVLYYYFSFVRGIWSSPILPVGYDANGEVVWREWNTQKNKLDIWHDHQQGVYSWFLELNSRECLVEVFSGFVGQWKDLKESLMLSIHWYVEGNKHVGGVEGSIVLIQAALEHLSWVWLVDKKRDIEKEKFKKKYNATSKKINCLLEKLSIPKNIPSSLSELALFESSLEHSANNGPYASTEVRNSITHADPENRTRLRNISSSAKVEAWEISLWYLELILLFLCDYKGVYSNRISRSRLNGGEEVVPWSKVE